MPFPTSPADEFPLKCQPHVPFQDPPVPIVCSLLGLGAVLEEVVQMSVKPVGRGVPQ